MAEPFKQRTPYKYVGSYRPRVDGWEKARGEAAYLDDMANKRHFPDLLYAKVLRSPYAHARIKKLDTSKAEALPGVAYVLRYDDPEITGMLPTTNAWTSTHTVPHSRMWYPKYRDRRVLEDTVRWVGDEAGVVVAAETEEIAERALKLLDIEWEVLPFVLDPEEAMAPGAPILHPEIAPDSNILPPEDFCGPDVFAEKGDVEAGFADAAAVVEVNSKHHRADHCCLDTRGCLMLWRNGQLTCWTNIYQNDQVRMFISEMTGWAHKDIRVVNPYAGGSFGRGNTGDQTFFIFCAILARRTGRPIKFKYTRREDFHDTRNSVEYWMKAGATKDGVITALYSKAVADSGAYSEHTQAAVKFVVKFDILEAMLSHLPAYKLEAYTVYTNKIPGSCMRGVGNIQFNLCFGLMVDALAEKLGMDPIELAIKNFGHAWEDLPSLSLESVLREGAARIGWGERHAPNAGSVYEGTKKRGIGFSFHNSWHAAWQEVIRGNVQLSMRVNPDLTVVLQAPQVETGVGSNSCAVFACAEALGFLNVAPEDIKWVPLVDSETGLKDMVQTDSAVSYLFGIVMRDAAEQVKAKILEYAAPVLEATADEMDIADARVFLKADPSRGVGVKDLLYEGDLVPIQANVSRCIPNEVTGTPFAASFAEVEVDTETGQTKVLRVVQCNDLGVVMYGSGAEGQEIGGQVIAVGESLTEEVIHDRATGAPLNFNWIDYTFPTILDFPDVEPVSLEAWQGAGDYGACGIGEVVLTCTPRAILNAIYIAVGVRINDIPVKPEKMLAALASLPSEGRVATR